ncbi:MAG: hypothetical protein IOD12_15000 [Silvanigrellales bacterium]|jgi:hypothetical protein|nr:hypothetical protein [Silvanigrellales bacterium]
MKTCFAFVSFLASLTAVSARADVEGVKLRDGDTVSYTFNYESDSGWADIFDCLIVIENASGALVSSTNVNLHDRRVACGGANRNETVVYRYTQDSDSGYTDRLCWNVGAAKPADLSYCGY